MAKQLPIVFIAGKIVDANDIIYNLHYSGALTDKQDLILSKASKHLDKALTELNKLR